MYTNLLAKIIRLISIVRLWGQIDHRPLCPYYVDSTIYIYFFII